jgi:hypothetical protein
VLYETNATIERFVQFIVLPDDWTVRPETRRELEFYITVILIKMCAFIDFNFNKWIMVHKMENVKFLKSSNVSSEV